MLKLALVVQTAAFLTCTVPSEAVELRPVSVRKGTEGLVNTPLVVANSGSVQLACKANLAHWYSTEIATVAPDATARIDLWFDPKTGTYTLLNDKQENMPVEALWCGIDGRAYATRAPLPLDRRLAAEHSANTVRCSADAGRTVCE